MGTTIPYIDRKKFASSILFRGELTLPLAQQPNRSTGILSTFPAKGKDVAEITSFVQISYFGGIPLRITMTASYTKNELNIATAVVRLQFELGEASSTYIEYILKGPAKGGAIIIYDSRSKISTFASRNIKNLTKSIKDNIVQTDSYITREVSDIRKNAAIGTDSDVYPIARWYNEVDTFNTKVRVRTAVEVIANSQYGVVTLPQQLLFQCPRINIFASTDVYYGSNLAQCILKTSDQEYSVYPIRFEKYIVSDKCTLEMKVMLLAERDNLNALDLQEWIITYGMLRSFLWKLITNNRTNCIDLRILQRKYNDLFLSLLRTSDYACYEDYLNTNGLLTVQKYFVYSL